MVSNVKPPVDLNPYFRKGILAATQNKVVSKGVRSYGMQLGANRFVAGESFDEAVPVLRDLNAKGLRTNTTLLGEAITSEPKVAEVVRTYRMVLDTIEREKLITNIALKPTQLGLNISEEIAYKNIAGLVEYAATKGNFIRMDMEESARVDATLRLYQRLRADGHENVGTVLQSALYRTPDDLTALLPLKPNLRLVKGAYLEPATVAYQDKADVDRAYIAVVERMLMENSFTAVATHDERIINHVLEFTDRHRIGSDRFEIQMLYGIRSQYQVELVRRGIRVLIATPFGPEWYYYLMRRLAERPANVLWFAKNAVRR